MNDKGRQYSAQQTQTGIVKGGGLRRPDGSFADKKVTGDQARKSQEAFLKANPPATLNVLRREGVPMIPFGVPGGQVMNVLKPFRDRLLGFNIDYFSDLNPKD